MKQCKRESYTTDPSDIKLCIKPNSPVQNIALPGIVECSDCGCLDPAVKKMASQSLPDEAKGFLQFIGQCGGKCGNNSGPGAKKGGLNGGEIAGIVIGSILGLALIALIIYMLTKKKSKK